LEWTSSAKLHSGVDLHGEDSEDARERLNRAAEVCFAIQPIERFLPWPDCVR